MNEVIATLLGSAVTLILGLLAIIVKLLRGNGTPVPNPPDPTKVKAGDMETAYWLMHFNRIHDQGVDAKVTARDVSLVHDGKLSAVLRKLDHLE